MKKTSELFEIRWEWRRWAILNSAERNFCTEWKKRTSKQWSIVVGKERVSSRNFQEIDGLVKTKEWKRKIELLE